MKAAAFTRRIAMGLAALSGAGLAGHARAAPPAGRRGPAGEDLPLPPPSPPPPPGGDLTPTEVAPSAASGGQSSPSPASAPPEPMPPADWSANVRVERISRGQVVRVLSNSQVGLPAGRAVPIRIVESVSPEQARHPSAVQNNVEVGWSLTLRCDPVGADVVALRYEFSEAEIESVRGLRVAEAEIRLPTLARRTLAGMALLRPGEQVVLRESLGIEGFLARTTLIIVPLSGRPTR